MLKIVAATGLAIALAGCAGTPAEKPENFVQIKSGLLPVEATTPFSTCVMEGFNLAHSVTTITARQWQRDGRRRIETVHASQGVLIATDVHDDGRVVLSEAKDARFLDTSKERAVFINCFEVFRRR